ncbi:MAG: hypothetical protein ACFFDM_10145 [Candidatus Thorarchaeota archaeon]
MEKAEITRITIEELYALIKELPFLWNQRGRWNDPLMELEINRFHESEDSIFGVVIYGMDYVSFILFIEFSQISETASFEIIVRTDSVSGQNFEKRIQTFLQNITREELKVIGKSLVGTFDCPHCKARYSTRSVKLNEEGLTECPNCGKPIQLVKE